MNNNVRLRTLLLAAIGLSLWGCTGARIVDPAGNLRDPLPAFTVQFDPNFVPGSFRAILDPGTFYEKDLTGRFTPTPQPGGSSAAPITEPFVGGELLTAGSMTLPGQTITNYGRWRHTLKVESDAKPYGSGFSLAAQRDRVEFIPVHVVFTPNLIEFHLASAGGVGRASLCLVPTPTRAVEVVVTPTPDSVPLSLNNGLPGQGIVVSLLPSGNPRTSCTTLEITGSVLTPIQPLSGIIGRCNGCQEGSAQVRVVR